MEMSAGAGRALNRNTIAVVRVVVVCAVVCSIAVTGVAGQTAPPNAYYGSAVTNDGTKLPAGTTIIAVADGSVRDRITVDPPGQYGGSDATDDKLRVSSDIDSEVRFYVERDDGTRIQADEVDPDPTADVEQFDLTFPVGTIDPQPNFAVSNLTLTETDVVEGDIVDVSATVTNSGTEEGTQVIALRLDGEKIRTKEITLAPDERRTVEFADFGTDGLSSGDHVVAVASGDDEERAVLTVRAPSANFTVSGLDPVETTVTEGATLDVSADITNEGSLQGTQTVSLRVGGETVASSEETLAAGASRRVVFADINTSQIGTGSYAHGVYTANDSQTGTLTINEEALSPSNFTVSGLEPAELTAVAGDDIEVAATVTNEGSERGTQTVQLLLDGSASRRQDVTLTSGSQTTVRFSGVATSSLQPGSHTYTMQTRNDSESGTLTLEPRQRAAFDIREISPTGATVTNGERIIIAATVRNDGGAEGTQQVRLQLDGSDEAGQSVTLASGDTATVEFESVDTTELTTGVHTYRVSTDNSSSGGRFTVEETADPATTPTVDATPATATQRSGNGTATATPSNGTLTPTGTPGNATATPSTDDGGLLPGGLLGTILTYVGIPVLVIYLILKAMAIYLGY